MRSVLNSEVAALDAVHLIALRQQQFGKVGAVLAGDACDQCGLFRHSRKNLLVHGPEFSPARWIHWQEKFGEYCVFSLLG